MVRVSVLLPVRNAAQTLPACLASLLTQTLGNFEIIAVDDHSADGSAELLASAAGRDGRLRVLPNAGRGLVAALETGRRACRAELIARMDADDLAHPDRLRAQVEHLTARPDLVACGTRVRIFPRYRLRTGWRRYETWLNRLVNAEAIFRQRFVESPLAHPTAMIRAEDLDAIGGYRDRGWPEDHDLWLRLLGTGLRIDKLPRTLLAWRDSDGRHSRSHPRYSPERFREMKLSHLLAGPLSGRREVFIWGAGRNGQRWAKLLGAAGLQVGGYIDIDPKKIGRRPQGAQVFGPERIERGRLPFILGAVARQGARALIRDRLVRAGRREARDFLFVQ